MKKTLFALTLLAGSTVFASDDTILAHIKVCPKPQDALLMKSNEITLTESVIRFDIENGPGRIQMGMGERGTLTFPVLSIKNVGLFKKGLEVKFQTKGTTIETMTIFNDSIDQYGQVTSADDCQN